MDILLARQPIFDARDQIAAYELFFRTRAGDALTPPPEPARILADAVIGVGLDRLGAHERLFFQVTPELITAETVRVLPAGRVVLELDATTPFTPELLEAVTRLVYDGYAFAASNVRAPLPDNVARLMEIAKIDVRAFDDEGLLAITTELRGRHVRLLAEHVEHREAQQHCRSLGFELFQGYRFSRPQTVVRRDMPVAHVHTYRLLKLLRTPSTEDQEIEELLKRDVTLTYKLLRIVNSAATGAREIWSVGHAIRLLGRESLARWVTLLLLADVGESGVVAELSRMAMTRARLCELLAEEAGLKRSGPSLFLVGLLSLLDQILETPMEDLVTDMELAPDVRDALLYRAEFFGEVLALVEAHEEGDWDGASTLAQSLGIADDAVSARWLEALRWAGEQDPRKTTAAA